MDGRSKQCRACHLARFEATDTKWCPGCKTSHPVEAFNLRPNGKPRSRCREAWAREARGRYAANPRKLIASLRASAARLGLDPDDIERRWSEHSGLCDCCGQPPPEGKRLVIEHDHATKEFRGFTCQGCNLMLGHAQDDPERLLAGVVYLRRVR